MFCFLTKGACVHCRNMSHHHSSFCWLHSLLHSVLPETFPLPTSGWLSIQLEKLSIWTLCSILQLVAYYFSHGSTKSNLFGEVLEWVQNPGLQFVATICNMGANSFKSLKLLCATRWKPFFKFQNQDIVTVYVPPHFLNCTTNLFLKYDIQLSPSLSITSFLSC